MYFMRVLGVCVIWVFCFAHYYFVHHEFLFFNSSLLFLDFPGFTVSRNSLRKYLGSKLSEVLADLFILHSHVNTNFPYKVID